MYCLRLQCLLGVDFLLYSELAKQLMNWKDTEQQLDFVSENIESIYFI